MAAATMMPGNFFESFGVGKKRARPPTAPRSEICVSGSLFAPFAIVPNFLLGLTIYAAGRGRHCLLRGTNRAASSDFMGVSARIERPPGWRGPSQTPVLVVLVDVLVSRMDVPAR